MIADSFWKRALFVVLIAVIASLFFGMFLRSGKQASKIDTEPSGSIQDSFESVRALSDGLCKNCNVILLSVDSLRADHMGAYGYQRDTTPNFDEFSKRGALFLNNFSSSYLTPVSEMSLQTGRYPTSHGVTSFDSILPSSRMTMAEYLKGRGYMTAAIITSPEFVGNQALKKSFSRGFDKYYSDPISGDPVKLREVPLADRLRSNLDAFGQKKFFLWVAMGRVHWPFGGASSSSFEDKKYDGVFKDKPLTWSLFKNVYENLLYPEKENVTPEDTQYVVDKYDDGIRSFDDFFGQFKEDLERRNLLENTLVIVESEHGEDLNEHGYFAHYDIMDTQTHVPLFVFIPSLAGKKITSLTSSVDVFPTLIESLGDTIPKEFQGKSLLPIMNDKEKDGLRDEVFIERNPLWEEFALALRKNLEQRGMKVENGKYKDIAIRTSEWKYILRMAKDRVEKISWWSEMSGKTIGVPNEELYNLKSDPGETKNVVEQYPEKAAEFQKKIKDWYAKILLTTPKKVEYEGFVQPYF